jgi:hypothetical protein
MMTNYGQELLRFSLNLLYCGNSYYIERVAKLEDALADVPMQIHLEMIGDGEIDADWALVLREVLNQRSEKTQLITNARSTLKNGSALVWLLGDRRLIREDARLFFRRANLTEEAEVHPDKIWNDRELQYADSFSEADPEEAVHAQVLLYIDEFLPVRELAGQIIDVRTLRQFGLVGSDKLDLLLAATLGPESTPTDETVKPETPVGEKLGATQSTRE